MPLTLSTRIAIFILFLHLSGWGDTIYLKDGKEYTGVFVGGSKTSIRFETVSHAIRTFPARDVDRIQFGSKPPAEPSPASTSPPTTGDETPLAANPPPPPSSITPPVGPPVSTMSDAGLAPSSPVNDGGAVDSAYTGAGGVTGILGSPIAPVQQTPDRRAIVRMYRNGAIYWTSSGGAHALYGPMREAWMQSGGESSKLGYPVSDLQDSNSQLMQIFEHGTINWNQRDGAHIRYNGRGQ